MTSVNSSAEVLKSLAPNPQSRVQVLNTPIMAPGKCVICGAVDSDNGRKYIDFAFQQDWYGAVYFCTLCMVDVSAACGYVPVKILADTLAEYQLTDLLLKSAEKEIKRLKNVLADALGVDPSRIVSNGDSLGSVPVVEEEHGESEGNSDLPEDRTEPIAKSSSVEGPADVHSSTDDDDSFIRDALQF